MAKYYYDRYTVSPTYSRSISGTLELELPFLRYDSLDSNYQYSSSYTFNTSTGRFSYAGSIIVMNKGSYPGGTGKIAGYYYRESLTRMIEVVNYVFQGSDNTRYFRSKRLTRSVTGYTRGSYVDTILAEDGTYPDNGRVGTSYWYIKRDKAFPELKVKINGQIKTSDEGWVKVNGVLRPIEQIWTKIGGKLREV